MEKACGHRGRVGRYIKIVAPRKGSITDEVVKQKVYSSDPKKKDRGIKEIAFGSDEVVLSLPLASGQKSDRLKRRVEDREQCFYRLIEKKQNTSRQAPGCKGLSDFFQLR